MILNLQGVHKTFGQRIVLDHIDWQLDEPQIVALVAPNGSGKTTLLDIIANLGTPDAGTVTLFDRSVRDYKIYQTMTYMQDSSVLFQNMTGYEHLTLIRKHYRLTKTESRAVAERVGIDNYLHKRVCHYSMGMKQLLLFAMAILPKPKLLLMDEPLNGLDPKSVAMLRETLQMRYRQGTTILFSSHNLDEIDRLTDHIFFLHQGKLIPAEMSARQRYVVVMTGGFQSLAGTKWADKVTGNIATNKFQVDVTPDELNVFRNTFAETATPILDVTLQRQSTEKQYFELFGENEIR